MKTIIKIINNIKFWVLVCVLIVVYICSPKVNVKATKACAHDLDSVKYHLTELEQQFDSMNIVYNSVMGERDALSRQLDRNASQQIVIDKRTTNITKQYIIDTSSVK